MERSLRKCRDCCRVGKSKTTIWFKGAFRCWRCKHKVGHDIYLPTINQVVLTKKELGLEKPKLAVGRPKTHNYPPKAKDEPITQMAKPERAFWVGLDKIEKKKLWAEYMKEGLSIKEATEKLEKVQNQVSQAHKKFSKELKENAPDFKIAFELLTQNGGS